MTQYLVLMSDNHVMEIPINQNGEYWYNWYVYYIEPTFSVSRENYHMKVI